MLYGIGAIVAVTALFGLFEHGPDSTGVADHRRSASARRWDRRAAACSVGEVLTVRAPDRVTARARPPSRSRAAAGALLACALAAAACDWRAFDDLKKKVPVAALQPPGDYPAGDDFGPILLAVPPPADRSSAGRFVAAAVYHTSVAVFEFDAAGNPKGTGITGTASISWVRSRSRPSRWCRARSRFCSARRRPASGACW